MDGERVDRKRVVSLSELLRCACDMKDRSQGQGRCFSLYTVGAIHHPNPDSHGLAGRRL